MDVPLLGVYKIFPGHDSGAFVRCATARTMGDENVCIYAGDPSFLRSQTSSSSCQRVQGMHVVRYSMVWCL